MMCQWYPALAPPIVALYAQAIEFRQALLDSCQKSESLHKRARWVDEEEDARPDSSSEVFPTLDPATMAVDKSDSILASAVQREDLEFAPCLEVGPGTRTTSSHLKAIDDQNQKIHFPGTRTSIGGGPRRTIPPQMAVCTNIHQKDGADRGFNQGLRPQRAATYNRETLVQSIEHSSNTKDGRSPTLDFEHPFQEVQAATQQITLPEKLADRAVDRGKEITRGPGDNTKVGVQNMKQGQELRKSTGRYELRNQVDEEGVRDDADGEQGDNDYEDDSETVDADPDLLQENKFKKFATRAIADTIVLDGHSTNHQSNKRAHRDTVAESPLSKRSKLTAHENFECQTPSTTTTSTENSFSETFWHKYDMQYKAMCNHSPRVKAVDIWRRLSTKISCGRSRSGRERYMPRRYTDNCMQPAREGLRYQGCRCPVHQGMYEDWPEFDAELTIAQCMRTCVYCGNSCRSASELRRHLKRVKYVKKNIRVYKPEPGQLNPTTPSWTTRLKIIDPNQSQTESTN
jgi:hypothetical protein